MRSPPSSCPGMVSRSRHVTVLEAGGFEWQDPLSDTYDQGVENPYKNPQLLQKSSQSSSSAKEDGSSGMKIDPARLLGPRLNGVNLYFIGMMGSGKTAVSNLIARRKYLRNDDSFPFCERFPSPHHYRRALTVFFSGSLHLRGMYKHPHA